jgi:hypothetical protein
MASTSVFVVEPGTLPEVSGVCESCDVSPLWLLYLCIAFGILFLVMLIINVFLCSAMACFCTKPSHEDKDISYIEDFDPYARSWQGSQYGSRYSLNGGIKTVPVPYLPADTTRSVSSTSEYGGGVAHGGTAGRPASGTSHRPRHAGPPSTSGSNSGQSKYSNQQLFVK